MKKGFYVRGVFVRGFFVRDFLVASDNSKQKLFMDWRKDPTDIDKRNKYMDYRNKFNALIRNTKNNYFKTKLQNNGSSKNLWKVIKTITSSKTEQKDRYITD